MTVNPPKTWGKITGTVTGAGRVPLAGATVQINTWATLYTLKTDATATTHCGSTSATTRCSSSCAKDGFQPQVATVRITKGTTTTLNFALLKD